MQYDCYIGKPSFLASKKRSPLRPVIGGSPVSLPAAPRPSQEGSRTPPPASAACLTHTPLGGGCLAHWRAHVRER